jgi:hypothetical protein
VASTAAAERLRSRKKQSAPVLEALM